MLAKRVKIASILLAALLGGGCEANFLKLNVKPTSAPMYNMSQGSLVLACVGRKIDHSRNTTQIDAYISDVPDHTTPSIESGFLTKNAVMMVTTAVDRLGTEKVQIVGRSGGLPGRRQVQILGAFTELNRTTGSRAMNGKSAFPGGIGLNLGGDRSFNHVALDMSMSENNRIIPSTSTSVSIQLHTKSGNATLSYDDGGDFAAVAALGFSAQEGFHAAERLLIEVSVALMVGRYFNVNVQDCLQRSDRPEEIDRSIFLSRAVEQGTPVPAATVHRPATAQPPAVAAPRRPSLIVMEQPVALQSDVKALPMADGIVVIPLAGKKRLYLPEQPQEYDRKTPGSFSGTSSGPRDDSFIGK